MNLQNYQIINNGDAAFTILFKDKVSYQLSTKIVQISSRIQQEIGHLLFDIIPAYQSITLCFDPLSNLKSDLESELKKILNKNLSLVKLATQQVEIPVCYEAEFAPDLEYLANYCQLTPQQVIQKHSAPNYLVHMLGFLPGFVYLGGLIEQLTCPRKAIPDIRIPSGSVAIGGNQTGIYPIDSPGGWHIIGRTPLNLFRPQQQQPYIASPLDQIKFLPIDKFEYRRLQTQYQ